MDTIQFRDFIFRHNPHSIDVSTPKAVSLHFCPGFGDVSQGLGDRAREVRLAGTFWGNTYTQALSQILDFQRSTAGGVAGMLFLPGITPFMARLRNFAFAADGDGRLIAYTMEFVEAMA